MIRKEKKTLDWFLAVEWPDRTIPWAGIGALLMGLGSALSGYAAYKIATRKEDKDEQKTSSGDN